MDIKRLRVGTKVKIVNDVCDYISIGDIAHLCQVPEVEGCAFWATPVKYNKAAIAIFAWRKQEEEQAGKLLGKICIGSNPADFKVLKY